MALPYDFVRLMPHTVTVSTSAASRDNYGKATYAAGTSYKARVVAKMQTIRDKLGEEKASSHIVYLNGVSGLSPEKGQITLPDGSKPPILLVETYPDGSGNYYEQIYLGY